MKRINEIEYRNYESEGSQVGFELSMWLVFKKLIWIV